MSMPEEFRFFDSVPAKDHSTRRSILERFADALKANPGRWSPWPTKINETSARVYTNGVNTHRGGCPPALRDPGFEAAHRAGVAYVRYVEPGYDKASYLTRLSPTGTLEVRRGGARTTDTPLVLVNAQAAPDGALVIAVETGGRPVHVMLDGRAVLPEQATR